MIVKLVKHLVPCQNMMWRWNHDPPASVLFESLLIVSSHEMHFSHRDRVEPEFHESPDAPHQEGRVDQDDLEGSFRVDVGVEICCLR